MNPKVMVTQQAVVKKAPIQVTVPVKLVEGLEGITLGFRAGMISCEHGGVATGAGLGNDWIHVDWKGKHFALRGLDLLAAVVATFDPEDAKAIAGAEIGGGVEVTAGVVDVAKPKRKRKR